MSQKKINPQDLNNPAPAALGSEQAGYRASISNDCNVTPVSLARVAANATSIDLQREQRPFIRSSALKRTPPSVSATRVERTEAPTKTNDGLTTTCKDAFTELGAMIVDLMEYVKTRNNVHHAIKEKVREIRVKYNKARDEKDLPSSSKLTNDRATQTTPNDFWEKAETIISKEPKKATTRVLTQPSRKLNLEKGESKRSREPADTMSSMETPKRARNNNTTKVINPLNQGVNVIETSAITENDSNLRSSWTTVKKKRYRKPKPDTIIISAKGEATYADILRKIRTDPALVELGNEVNKIRRNQKGDLLLELKTTSKGIGEKFNDKVEASLEGQAEVKTHREHITIECKDMDVITTVEEICTAFQKTLELPSLKENIVKSVRKAYGGTQTAIICLPAEAARKALQIGKIKIGRILPKVRS